MSPRPVDRHIITVSAVVLTAPDGRWLTVRKRGTSRFMHPGGKPEVGESARDAAIREVAEELGVAVDPAVLIYVGHFVTETANEPGSVLHAEVFACPCPGIPGARSEIEELRWVDPIEVGELDEQSCAPWAPLLVRVARERARL